MVISDTSWIGGLPLLYWCRNLGKSGQDSTLSNVLNTIRLCKPGFTKSHMTLDNIVDLGNRTAYDFGRDRTTAQLCSYHLLKVAQHVLN